MHLLQWPLLVALVLALAVQSVPMSPDVNHRLKHIQAPFKTKERVLDYFMTGKGQIPEAQDHPVDIMDSLLQHQAVPLDEHQFGRIWMYFTQKSFSEKILSRALQLMMHPTQGIMVALTQALKEPFMQGPLQKLAFVVEARFFMINTPTLVDFPPDEEWSKAIYEAINYVLYYELPYINDHQFLFLTQHFNRYSTFLTSAFFYRLHSPTKDLVMSWPHKERKLSNYYQQISQVPTLDPRLQPPVSALIIVQAEEATNDIFIDEYFFKGDDKKWLRFYRDAVMARIEVWGEKNPITPAQFERIAHYYSGEAFDAEVRSFALEFCLEPTLETIKMISEHDDRIQRSKVIARYFIRHPKMARDHSLAKIGQLGELSGFEYVLTHEVKEINPEQFFMLLFTPTKTRSILNLAYQRLNDDVKKYLRYKSPSDRHIIQYLNDKMVALYYQGDQVMVSRIQQFLEDVMENGALKKAYQFLSHIGH